jgi:type III pantothenate kinase
MELLRPDLVLDAGNTRLKAALMGPSGLIRHAVLGAGDAAALRHWLDGTLPGAVVLGSVAAADPAFEDALAGIAPLLVVAGDTPSPLRMAYGTPGTLGVDRLANAVGAWRMFPGRPVVAVDLGTCITYDVVDGDGTYQGGLITPGLRMRASAMHAFSARLPEVEPADAPALVGRSTRECLEAGIHHGIRAELRTLLADLAHEQADAAVVLTGGDALRFARALKSGIFAAPLLTLQGLHALLLHHRSLAGNGPADDGGRAGAAADR